MSLRFDQISKDTFTYCPYMQAEQGELDLGLREPIEPYPRNGISFDSFDKHCHFIESHNYMQQILD